MFKKKFIGWIALALFVSAVIILILLLILVIVPSAFAIYISITHQAMIVAAGILAFMACVSGFYAFETPPGRVGAIGEVVLVTVVLLSLTTITSVEKHDAKQIQTFSIEC